MGLIALAVLLATWVGRPMPASGASPTGAVIGVASNSGELRFDRRGTWRELLLPVVDNTVLNVRLAFASSALSTGRGQSATVVVRRRAGVGEYRVRTRLTAERRVEVAVVRVLGGERKLLGRYVLPGLVVSAGSRLALRVHVGGSAQTAVSVKAWPAGAPEPPLWMVRVTDTSPALARAGSAALRFAVSRTMTNVPVRISYSGVRAVVQAPTSDPDPAPSPPATPTASPTATPSPTPTATPSPTPSPTATPSPTPTPTPTVTPTPTATPSPNDSAVPAGAVFVAPTGNDSAAGTRDAPWRTLQKAAASVSAGATVVVREGTYGPFVMRRSGTASAPITFMAYPGEAPIVDGRGQVDYTIKLSAVRHVIVTGLTVQGGYAERQAGGGIMVEGSSYVVVRDNLVRDNHSFGVRSYNSDHVLVDDNEITGNAVGVTIGRGNEGTVVSNNLIHDNNQMMINTADVRGDDAGAEGITLVRSTGRVVVRGNYIWGNRARSYDYDWDGGAFSIHAASNWTITDNVTWDNRNVLETGTDAGAPCDNGSFTRNLNYAATTADRTVGMVLRCASNTLIANNTFHGMQYWVFAISHYLGGFGGSVDGLRIVNNVVSVSSAKVYGIDSDLPASVVIDHNVVHNSGAGYLATVKGKGTSSLATFRSWTGFEEHGLAVDPRFVDAAANDFRLRADSAAVDSGRDIAGVTDGYAGAGPDRGYAERR